jgi:ATP-dependent helicase/nuclease subunit A
VKTLADAEVRQQIRSQLDVTLVVEAAAGTGKTTELVHRVMALLRSGKTTLARLVAVTFTEKAAGEMKLRLRTEIERARNQAGPEERTRLDQALAELEQAHIGTIHGFCAELLRQRPVEARVDPLFEAADEQQQERLFDEAFDRWFQVTLSNPPEGVRRILRRRSRDRDRAGPREALRRAGLSLVNQRDFDAAWRRDPFERKQEIDALLDRLGALGAFAARAEDPDDWGVKSIVEVERFMAELRRREAIVGRDYDGVEQELYGIARGKGAKFWGWKGRGQWFGKGIKREDVFAQRAAAKEQLDRVLQHADADLAACLHEDLQPLVASYEALKTRAGKLDFLDLLLRVRNLVRDDRSVRSELQARFTHILVDEFQDTDPLQAEILLLLAADDPEEIDFRKTRPIPGKLFVVGDPKQSIYRFRRADVTLYEATKRRLVAHGARLVRLSTSFRSVPSLQATINAAFAPLMTGSDDGSQAEYVPLEPLRDEPGGQPSVVALPVPRPYSDWGQVAVWAIDKSLPDAVGAFVDWLIRKSRWTVTERERPTERVAVEARHVCLLFRRFVNFGHDVTRPYVRALEARQIPHVLVGGRSFHAREEVIAVRNALTAIEWPDDELSVFATLRGPFFAMADDALLAFRHAHGSLHPLKRLDDSALDDLTRPVQDALYVLRRLHIGRNRRPTADTVAQLLDATRAHAGVAIWPTGEQALANLLRVLDLARRFEAAGATSFRAFVQRLDDEAERGAAAEAPVVEEGTDGVRMMTVHKAKGLEFPVVVLVDPTCPAVQQEPSRYIDGASRLWVSPLAGCPPVELAEHREEVLRHDAEEAVRLAYVAATRARELLVVPTVGDGPIDGWVEVFSPVLYPSARTRRSAKPAPGCPPFSDDSVLERSERANRDSAGSVMPGLHVAQAGTHGVVWWDPLALELDKQEQAGLRQQRILAADERGIAAEEGNRGHSEWQARRASLLERGSKPTFVIQTATGSKDAAVGVSTAVFGEMEQGDGDRGRLGVVVRVEKTSASGKPRPHGVRFGILVHAVLARIPLDANEVQVRCLTRTHGQMLSATNQETEAAAEAVAAALQHPVMRAARGASEVRRETPMLLREGDGALVEGVLDLAFRITEDAGVVWVVVDYKTDAEVAARQTEYEHQIKLYARAVAGATGESARGVLLRV